MRIITGHDEFLTAWVSDRINLCSNDFGECATMGFVNGKHELIAAVVFSEYRPDTKDIRVSIAADTPRWATKNNIRAIFEYPFKQLGCERLTVIVAKKNKRSRKLVQGVGFVEEGNLRKGFLVDDAIIYGMLKAEAAKWIK